MPLVSKMAASPPAFARGKPRARVGRSRHTGKVTDALLIGRDRPAATLRTALERTVASHGGLVLVTGEAGIGKTALVTGVAADYREDALVAFATSWESEAVPEYWLWTQVLRSLRGRLGEDAWRAMPTAGPAIAALLGEADGAMPAQFELFDAVTQVLVAASHRRPLVVVLDDLHFADDGSVELLKFASQHTWFERILFVPAYRDSEIDSGHRLRARMLPLVAKATVITLDGLDETGVAELVRTTVGSVPDAEVVAEITRRTGGNPFFVEQTAQLWASGQRVDATTASMRDALERRIDQLPEPLLRMLTLASVGGREFHPAIMSQAAGIDTGRIEAALEAACQARLIRRERSRYVFVHDLVRETLYRSMSEGEAAHHHGCVVRALVADESLQKFMLNTEIAHHAWLAGDDLDPEIAVDFLARAGAEANGCFSAGGAEKHFRRALERSTPEMTRRRVLLRLDLAGAVNWLRREDEARVLYERALVDAEESGDPMLLTRAVMEVPQEERVDELVRLKTVAYEGLAGRPPAAGTGHEELTRGLLYRYMLAARDGGSDEDLAFGLWATHSVSWGPGTAAGRRAVIAELSEVARRTGDTELRLYAESLGWVVLLEQGDPAYRAQIARFCALAEHAEPDHWQIAAAVDRAIADMIQGRFEDAEARLEASLELTSDDPMRAHMLRHMRWELRMARGDVPDAPLEEWGPAFGVWHTDLLTALTALQRGDLDRARDLHARLGDGHDLYGAWESLRLRFEVELAVADGDTEAIARLRERLGPHEGEWLIAAWGTSVNGPVGYWLGVLAAAAGDTVQAAAHFESTIEQAERLEAAPWAERARKDAAALTVLAPGSPIAASGDVFRRDGATWTLRYGDRTVHLPHTKGLADLHRLLQCPHTEVPAVGLLDPEAGAELAAAAGLGGDDLVDAEARARYRDHLQTLDERIDTAVALGDDARATVLDAERQALIDQLKAATGLGGRSRRLGDNAERARKSVTNRIRNALKKIEGSHPPLAEHLRSAVTTGSSCAYRPEGGAPRWLL